MARIDEQLDYLGNVPLFASCSKKELKALQSLCDRVDVAAGKELVRQGTTGYECFVLLTGTADVTINGRFVTSLGPGAYFGELALLDKQPRSATVTASSASSLLVLGPRQFSTALESFPGLAQKMLAGLAQRLREANSRVAV
jgi:CRP/FNR family transcriptional regulator, cyclic AMP receptor protein